MIIYPPLISDLIPAFVIEDDKVIITIPYEMNPAVGIQSIKTMRLQIKDYLSSYVIIPEKNNSGFIDIHNEIIGNIFNNAFYTDNFENNQAIFEIPCFNYTLKGSNQTYTFPTVGQYYKLQIAYDDQEPNINNTYTLTYSSASLGRCIGVPVDVYLTDLKDTDYSDKDTILNTTDYMGVYSRDQLSEPLYSYCFEFYDEFNTLVETSGEQIWNSSNDNPGKNLCSQWGIFGDDPLKHCNPINFKAGYTYTWSFAKAPTSAWRIMVYSDDFINHAATGEFLQSFTVRIGSNAKRAQYSARDLTKDETSLSVKCYKDFTAYAIQVWNTGDSEEVILEQPMLEMGQRTSYEPYGIIHSTPKYHLNYNLEYNKHYYMDFTIKTVNGYTKTVSKYIDKELNFNPNYEIPLGVETNYNDGYINIYVDLKEPKNDISAQFVIERAAADQLNWKELTRFAIGKGMDISKCSWKDFTIEQGKTYYYRIRQYNNGFYSSGIVSQPVVADFEDMFLSDGEQQLKIRFNPRVSSFKTTLLESKTDSIGNKYPYFFRNGQVGYKEIPISGLISYLMDDNQFFISWEDLGLADNYGTTNLTRDNIASEREFKLKVMDWLNNGQPKLFRSPGEGNYVVRLMNVSLSPNDTLSRMLHTFSCTGYEVAAADYDSLKDLGIFYINQTADDNVGMLKQLRPETNGEIFYNIKNLLWTNSLYEEHISIKLYQNEKEIVLTNYSGYLETPKDAVYDKLEIIIEEGYQGSAQLTFIQLNAEYNQDNDKFGEGTLQSEWTSYNNIDIKNPIEIKNTKHTIIHYVAVTGNAVTGNDEDDTYIIIKDTENSAEQTIDLSDGRTRFYDAYFYSMNLYNAHAIVYKSDLV